jgi:hypothetical protein
MNEHPDHLTLMEGIPALLEMSSETPQAEPLPEAVLRIHAQGERETRAFLPTLYGTYLDIFALSGYLTRLVASGEHRAAHHFFLLLYTACRLPVPRALVDAVRSDLFIRSYVAGALSGIRLEEQLLSERYADHMEDSDAQ